MNWERLFYWLTIADNIHVILVITTVVFGTGLFLFGLLAINSYLSDQAHLRKLRKYFLISSFIFSMFGIITLLTPDEDDLMLMISGTAVGTVLDTTATYDNLPKDVANFLRAQIVDELEYTRKKTREYLKILTIKDTLKYIPREELYEIIASLSKPCGITPEFSE